VNRLVQLFVSGCNAPRSSYNREAPQELSDAQLINELRKLNGTPEELLSNPEFLALFIPTLRADFRLVDRYVATHETPLDVPVTVLAGSRDPCTDVKGVEDWRRETRRCTSVHWFDGEHFFVNSHQKLVLDCVATELQKCTDARGTHRELAPP
jgi:medium-chain acyl-[acyl-carrier-protein] hydrolase